VFGKLYYSYEVDEQLVDVHTHSRYYKHTADATYTQQILHTHSKYYIKTCY